MKQKRKRGNKKQIKSQKGSWKLSKLERERERETERGNKKVETN